jgi:hypothetical protein
MPTDDPHRLERSNGTRQNVRIMARRHMSPAVAPGAGQPAFGRQ